MRILKITIRQRPLFFDLFFFFSEKLMVQVLKKQGDYGAAKVELRDSILQMHQDGCKDKRLKQLADAIGLDLPRRKSNKSLERTR
jgi:hypothetical protein